MSKNRAYSLFILFILINILSSCSDAEIVSGTFKGKIYRTDTIDATVQIIKINDGYIRIGVTSQWMSEAYIDYAQLIKNAPDAYNLKLLNDTGGFDLTGYYYEGFLHVNSWSNGYTYEGQKQ